MKNAKKKRNILFLLMLLLISTIIVPQSSSKYKTTLQKELTLNIRQPEYTVLFNHILPDEYQEVAYIQTSGTQYIDTGFIPTNNTKIETKFNARAASNLYISTANDSYTNNYSAYTQSTGGNWRFGNERKSMQISYNTDNIAIQDKSGIVFNGTLYSYDNTNEQNFTSSVNLFIFGNSTSSGPFKGKLYYLKIWENGVLTRSYVPCYRKSDDVIGLYDMVTKTFYTNDGEGDFTIGADVTNGYHAAKSQHFTYGTAQKLTANDFIKTGYIFINWNTESDGSGISYMDMELVNNLTTIDGDIIRLYSQWLKNNYQNLTTLKYYQTLNDAFAEVANGEVIQAIADNIIETTDATLALNKTTIVDVNGKNITFNNKKITNNGTLDVYSSVDGGVLQGSATNVIQNNGTFTANGTSEAHTLSIIGTSNSPSQRILRNNTSSSIATLNDNVTITYNNSDAISDYRHLVYNTGTLYIDGATLTNNITQTTKDRGIYNGSYATARTVITSGTINTYGLAVSNTIGNGTSTPAIEISGNNTTISSRDSYAIYNSNDTGKVLINGGTLQSTNSNAIVNTSTGIIEVNGGTITGAYGIYNDGAGIINVSGNSTNIQGTSNSAIRGYKGTVTVTGGTITGATYGVYITSDENNIGSMNISGGNIISDSMALYVSGSSTLTMSGGIAQSTAHSGIYIARDGTATVTGGTVTGYTNGIYNEKNGTINVSGNSTTITGTTSTRGISGGTGTINVSGGTITGASHGISATSDENNTGTVTVTGGTITGRARNGIFLEGNAILTLGTDDNTVSTVSPVIQTIGLNNDDYGVYMSDTAQFNFYDGIVIAASGLSINKNNTFITDTPNGYTVIRTMDNGTESAYLSPKYTVTFNANSGTGTMQDQEFVYGMAQNLLKNMFEKIGYTFNNWNKLVDGTGTSYEDEQNVSNLTDEPNGVVPLYAQWKPEFEVTGNPTGWTNQDVTLTVVHTNTTNTFEYSFDGGTTWQNSPSKTYTQNQNQIQIKIKDTAGNESDIQTIDITKIDKIPPTITFAHSPLIVTLDELNPIETLITPTDNESGIDSNGLLVYRYVISTGRRTDQITNTTYFTYPGLYAIDVEVSDNAGNTTSLNSQILVRWPTAGRYVVAKTKLDGADIAGVGMAYTGLKNGLYQDTVDTGLDSSLPFSSKYYYSGKTVDNYLSFAGKTYSIINVAVNDDIKVIAPVSSNTIRWNAPGGVLGIGDTNYYFYNTLIYSNWVTKFSLDDSQGRHLYNSDDSQNSYFTSTEWAHVDEATFYAGSIDRPLTTPDTIANTINQERTLAPSGGGSPAFTSKVAFPNVSDYLKACNYMDLVFSIRSSQLHQPTFRDYSWLADGAEQWTVNAKLDSNDYWVLDTGTVGNEMLSNGYSIHANYRPVFYLKNDTILSGTGTSSDPYTVQEDWSWFDNAQVLQ